MADGIHEIYIKSITYEPSIKGSVSDLSALKDKEASSSVSDIEASVSDTTELLAEYRDQSE